jgi:oxazoline/thiazoline dehydrogenase
VHPAWTVTLRDDVSMTSQPDGQLAIGCPYGRLTLRKLPGGFGNIIQRLAQPGETWGTLYDAVRELDVRNPVARLFYYLQYLSKRGYLVVSAIEDGRPLATLDPTAFSFDLPQDSELAGRFVLSRFAYLREKNGNAVLETPRSASRILLHDDRLAGFVASLMRPFHVADAASVGAEAGSFRHEGLSPNAASQFLSILAASNMLARVEESGVSEEVTDTALQTWEFHDLLFHSRSRRGRHDLPSGATFRFLGKSELPPAVAPPVDENSLALDRPDMAQLTVSGPSFASVVENRTSCREFATEPLTANQLGEFLYRVGRIRQKFEMDAGAEEEFTMEFTSRPYPAGGSLYELEIYPIVVRCEGVEPGLYHYDALQHRLETVSEPSDAVQQILWDACESTGAEYERVQVLFILSARFQRIAWKYAGMAYALILKHVGVLYQTMYLTATAMGLGGCAIGMGDADAFSEAIRSNYYTETSVGEFLLGTKESQVEKSEGRRSEH